MLRPLCWLSHSSPGARRGSSTLSAFAENEWVLGFIPLSVLFVVVCTSVSAANGHRYSPSQSLSVLNFAAPFSNFRSCMSSSFTFVFFCNSDGFGVTYFPLNTTLTAQSFSWIDIFMSWPFIIPVWMFWLRFVMGIFPNFQAVNAFFGHPIILFNYL